MTPPVYVPTVPATRKKLGPKKLEVIRKTMGCIDPEGLIDSVKICNQVRGKA